MYHHDAEYRVRRDNEAAPLPLARSIAVVHRLVVLFAHGALISAFRR